MVEPLLPMMRPAEQTALLNYLSRLSPDAQVLEFGSGGSTLLIAQQLLNQKFFSVEHNRGWATRVVDELNSQGLNQKNIHILLRERSLPLEIKAEIKPVEGQEGQETPYLANYEVSKYMAEECTAGLNGYLSLDYGNDWAQTELVFCDGIARGAVLAVLRFVLKPGTIVMLHDYEECEQEAGRQEWYGFATKLYRTVETVGSLLVMRV